MGDEGFAEAAILDVLKSRRGIMLSVPHDAELDDLTLDEYDFLEGELARLSSSVEARHRKGLPPKKVQMPKFKHIPTMDHFPEAIPVIRDHSDDRREAERMAAKLYGETGRMAYIVYRPQQAKKGSRAGYLVLDPKPWRE
jgi:hypothetical protein